MDHLLGRDSAVPGTPATGLPAGERSGGVELAERPAPARSRRSTPRPVPVTSPEYAHLSLEALRAYRKQLTDEESKVSYWRRIIQARLDVVRAGVPGREVEAQALRPVLSAERVGAGRQALVDVVPVDDIPPLPRLDEVWERRVDPSDSAAVEQLDADLTDAEDRLSAYRHALHRRIADATVELIARYRAQPTLCLSALPLRPSAPAPRR